MSQIIEKSGISGRVVVQEINPKTREIVSEEIGENVICVGGANAISVALTTGAFATTFDFMVISTDATAAARASVAIAPQTAVSTQITPTYDNTAPTSKTIWEYTFPYGGSDAIAKFGMQSTDIGGVLWNEYVFSALKDNLTNDLKITYTASFAP
jgi:hypothetical protein